ncbi:MAG TPA: GWxTD domain-containing protein [Gemmatimonadaceae bacterium]|nr:GWxTD domain-containing protein [Gemmatimonadaceae bacterium]
MGWTLRPVTHLRAIAFLCTAAPALAQPPEGSDKLTPAAVAESLAVLRQLDSAVRANPDDAAAWFRRGMIAWALYERDRNKPPIAGLDWTTLGRLADTSLRRALLAAPDSARYHTMAGRYLLVSGVSLTRWAAASMFRGAVDAARRGGDSIAYAEAAVEAGRVHWRRYDAIANRAIEAAHGTEVRSLAEQMTATDQKLATPTDPARVDPRLGYTRASTVRARRHLEQAFVSPSLGFIGELDYLQAEMLFREGFDAARSHSRAYRQLAMLLAERRRWKELGTVAKQRVDAIPTDAWAWMTYALAIYRMGDTRVARAAFDSALSRMPREERERLDRLDRVLRSGDSARFVGMTPQNRDALTRHYWLSADPMWSRDGNEPRVEFLARITYAEIRWTVEELNVRGADTDRGNIYIRLGPPDAIRTEPMDTNPNSPNVHWDYDYEALTFHFRAAPTFATAYVPNMMRAAQDELVDIVGVSWRNMEPMRIDSMPVQSARFRAPADSVDLLVAVLPPVAEIARFADLATPVRTDFWMHAGGTVEVARDSVVPATASVQQFRRRVGPGVYVYRAESSADGSRAGGRATAAVLAANDTTTGFATRGFAISDVLIASSARASGGERRWSDANATPLVGPIAKNATISLIWENYDLGATNGAARYDIAVVLQRQQSVAGRIAARVVGTIGRAAGIDRTSDRVTIKITRDVAHAPILVDNVEVALGETPAGTYLLQVQITDRVTGRTTARTMRVTIK